MFLMFKINSYLFTANHINYMMEFDLSEWWAALAGIEKVFWGIAIISSILFFIQFVLSLIGLDFDSDFDVDTDTGLSTDASFTVFSVRSFVAFFTFFGWAGIGVLNNGGSPLLAIGLGLIAGFLAMALVGYMMYAFTKMEDSGSVFNPYEALDQEGTVYLRIPPNQEGKGKIQITLQGALKEIDAMSNENKIIPTGAAIRVVDIIDDKIMVVEPVQKYLN